MAPSTRPRLFLHLVPLAALLFALVVAVGPVAAITIEPNVTTNPALVPFDPTPGKPGTTTVTFFDTNGGSYFACGQDNAQPPFKLGTIANFTNLVVPFPFIQAGTYTFWVSLDAGCDPAKKYLSINTNTPVQATAKRLGPRGFPDFADDDVQVRIAGLDKRFNTEVGSLGGANVVLTPTQQFPIPGVQVCIMSHDGAQVNILAKIGQDSRVERGLGAAAVTTTVQPFAGQNGCFDVPWAVNGGYRFSTNRSAPYDLGFCLDPFLINVPSNPPTPSGIGKCAQVVFDPSPNNGSFPPGRTLVNGSIVTGADNHAVQVCVSAFSPDRTPGRFTVPFLELANQVNAYNGSGAVNLTPLDIGFPPKTVVKITTYDITGPGPGGTGGAQFVCPPTTATQEGNAITAITAPDVPGATIIDTENYFRS